MMNINSCLIRMGLTNNEATIYFVLSTHGEMTGYECAKLTGISRSNVYIALAGLCEKGGAFVVDGRTQKYSPAPIGEFCANKRREFDNAVNHLLKNMPLPAVPSSAYITVSGAAAILNKMINMIEACTQRIYISADSTILAKLSAELINVLKQGLKVVVMTDSKFELDGAIIYNMIRRDGQIRLIVDSRFVLTGDFFENRPCSCLFSSSETLVALFKDAMKNEIRLIELDEMEKF